MKGVGSASTPEQVLESPFETAEPFTDGVTVVVDVIACDVHLVSLTREEA